MCGRYRNLQSWADLHIALSRFLGTPSQPALNLESQEQIRPTQSAPIVMLDDHGMPIVGKYRWWLVPWFHRGALKEWKSTTFNARAETIATSRAYRGAFKRRRCMIVADGWYEWMGRRADSSGRKQPWLFEPRDREPIMLAGLWDSCETSDAGRINSFTIVTQTAGAPLNGYHDRAPVVLFGDHWSRWLDTGADVSDLLGPESADRFTVSAGNI